MLITCNYPQFPQVSGMPYQLMLRGDNYHLQWGSAAEGLFLNPLSDNPSSGFYSQVRNSELLCPDIANFGWGADDCFFFWEKMTRQDGYSYGMDPIPNRESYDRDRWHTLTLTKRHLDELEKFYRWMKSLKDQGAPVPNVHELFVRSLPKEPPADGRPWEGEWLVWKLPYHPRTQGISLERERDV